VQKTYSKNNMKKKKDNNLNIELKKEATEKLLKAIPKKKDEPQEKKGEIEKNKPLEGRISSSNGFSIAQDVSSRRFNPDGIGFTDTKSQLNEKEEIKPQDSGREKTNRGYTPQNQGTSYLASRGYASLDRNRDIRPATLLRRERTQERSMTMPGISGGNMREEQNFSADLFEEQEKYKTELKDKTRLPFEQ
jgi:hypothetical protein